MIKKEIIIRVLLSLVAFSMPLGVRNVEYFSTIAPKAFNILVVVLFLVTLLLSNFKLRFNQIPVVFRLFLIFTLVHYFISYSFFYPNEFFNGIEGERNPALINITYHLIFIIFMLCISESFKRENNIRLFTVFYSVGLILSILLSNEIKVEIGEYVVGGDGRLTGGFLNPNTFAVSAFMVFMLNLYVLAQPQNGTIRLLYLVFALVAFTCIFLSQSRGAILGVFITFLFLFYTSTGIIRKLKYSVVAIFLALAIFPFLPESVTKPIKSRFTSHGSSEGDRKEVKEKEERIIIWEDYINQLPQYAFHGYGAGRATEVTKYSYRSWKVFSTHNKYLNVLVEYGFLGLSLFILSLYAFYQRIENNYKFTTERRFKYKIILAFTLGWISILFFGDYYNNRDLWLLFGLLVAIGNSARNFKINRTRSDV